MVENLISERYQNRATKIASEYVYEETVLGKTPSVAYRPAIRKAIMETGAKYGYQERENEVNVVQLKKEIKVTKDKDGKQHHFIITSML